MGRAVMHAGVGGRLHRYSCCAGLEPCGTVSPMKPTVSDRISPRDLMARDHLDHYFRVGEGAINEIERLLDNEPERILDLPCGHGRLMRWLRAAYPYAEIVGCDLDPDAVNFCAETFGSTPVQSHEDPAKIRIEGKFDLIVCGSLLTHLNGHRWPGFLSFFHNHLDGLLVFSTNGPKVRELLTAACQYGAGGPASKTALARLGAQWFRSLTLGSILSMMDGYDRIGFGHAPYAKQDNYGLSVSSPEWVKGQLRDFELVSYRVGVWGGSQDAVAVRA